ncbi:MAG: alpha/beta hydrolase [Spirochaetes bacterium]|nr:alpha/beta hydrolase [Spirochaetota bacterium]
MFLIMLLFISFCAGSSEQKNKIEIFEPINVNGTKQWILVRGNDESKPVLLYLHGGPGQSLIPFAYKATDKLINDFIVVYWDQRGAGLSFDEKIPEKTMTIDQFVKDTKTVTEFLKKKFKKEKIYLLGHSWGSTLGTLVVQKYPEDYYAYIGVGQVVKPEEQERAGINWLKEILQKEKIPDELKAISAMEKRNFANRVLIKKYGGTVHNISANEVKKIMNNSPYFPEKYTTDLYNDGLYFAMNLHVQVRKIDFFKTVPELKIPIYFFLGKYDYITPTEPVVRYFNMLKCPKKEIIWFDKSAHRMDIEEPDKFQQEILKIAK